MLKSSHYTLIACAFLAGCSQMSPTNNLTASAPIATDQGIAVLHNANNSSNATAPQAEPVEVISGPKYEDLWTRMRDGYQLSEMDNKRIDQHLKRYLRHPDYLQRVTERGNSYLYYIVSELEARNMPLELALLPIVESAFDPFAYSHGRASGMWQFIPSTGKHFGLKQNWWYDGRRDVLASTDAALTYLSQLNKRFDGDWLLALAAYNAGGGNVNKAIRANKRKGKPTDFWSLDLPKETQSYVPQLIAISKIVKAPEKYNVTLSPVQNQPFFEAVDTGSQIDLAQAAQLADISLDDLYKLNAGFNRWATDPKGPHRLLVPVEKAEGFKDALNQLPSGSRVGWERYKVKSGDSLLAIAKRFNTTVDVIREHNNIRGNLIRKGQMVLIPQSTLPADQYAHSVSQRVKRIQANSKGSSDAKKVSYSVKSGDSLWSIAKRYGVSVSKLAKWNAMAPKDTLRANQKLVIWTSSQSSGTAASTGAGSRDNSVIRKVAYRVRSGDSLARIAGKFHLSVNDIVRWNPIKRPDYLKPGQSLTLFVDVTRTN
ncbi:LysM peptidoglycan-binding domain-containing protein [Aestuariicella sp. G3-2]|uniref:lytic transglycosylase n=1 Tax=Pseudomaricurvus albidus TaxID=2842452 RepID=UPI001C0E853B|nr:LysM peptidoglycan-binding domain-containing protein [Aestuariicella albida]MBU3070088.1 LysM peptidoglycan-binding domain-containing protein [Aestuariicella albida]